MKILPAILSLVLVLTAANVFADDLYWHFLKCIPSENENEDVLELSLNLETYHDMCINKSSSLIQHGVLLTFVHENGWMQKSFTGDIQLNGGDIESLAAIVDYEDVEQVHYYGEFVKIGTQDGYSLTFTIKAHLPWDYIKDIISYSCSGHIC